MLEYLDPQAILIIATVFILFVSKVIEMVKQRNAERASRDERRRFRAERKQQRAEASGSPYRQAGTTVRKPAATPPPSQQQPKPQPQSPLNDVLRELFEAAGVPTQQRQETQKQAPSRQPPPIPDAPAQHAREDRRRSKEPALTKEEKAALERLERRRQRSGKATGARGKSHAARQSVKQLLLSPDTVTQAVVAAEILGPPRALRDLEER